MTVATAAWTSTDLPRPTTDLAQAERDLDDWGYCILADALSPEQLARVRTRLVEQAEAEAAAGLGRFDTGRFPDKHERRASTSGSTVSSTRASSSTRSPCTPTSGGSSSTRSARAT